MFAVTRGLICRNSPFQVCAYSGCKPQSATPPQKPVKMRVVPAVPLDQREKFDERNTRLGRFLSPDLAIYKPQLTTVLSITHRLTGLILATTTSLLGISSLVTPYKFPEYVTMLEGLELTDVTLSAIKFIITYPFAYHACGGVRHLIWDTGSMLTLKGVYSTGYAMLLMSLVLSGAFATLFNKNDVADVVEENNINKK